MLNNNTHVHKKGKTLGLMIIMMMTQYDVSTTRSKFLAVASDNDEDPAAKATNEKTVAKKLYTAAAESVVKKSKMAKSWKVK